MIAERCLLDYLQGIEKLKQMLPGGIWYETADETTDEPFAVIHLISEGAVRESGSCFPWIQLDIYARTRWEAVEVADSAIGAIENGSYANEVAFIQGIRCSRAPVMQVENGIWKVPIDVRFSAKEY